MFDRYAWLLLSFSAYWAVCVIVSIVQSQRQADAAGFFAPAGGIRTWAFVFIATTGMYAGWAVIGQPAQTLVDGVSFTSLSFLIILSPLAGTLILKRQWRLGRQFGYLTAGEMLSDYFGGEAILLCSVGIALLFAIPFLATLYGASGALISALTDGVVSREAAMWTLSAILLLYSVAGGLSGIAEVGIVQGVLFLGAAVALGGIAVNFAGGFESLGQALARLASSHVGAGGSTRGFGGGDYNGLFALPGVIQFTSGLGRETPVGGPWTAIMGLTFALSFIGTQLAPGVAVLSLSSRGPRAFAIHHIWGSALCIGAALFLFLPLQGLSAMVLGASVSANDAKLSLAGLLPSLARGEQADLVANYIHALPSSQGWLLGLLAVAVTAALQSTASLYLVTTGNIVARDVYLRYFQTGASWEQQRAVSRIAMLLLCLAALVMATFSRKALLFLAALASPCSFQLLPSFLGALWAPWITRRAATLGLAVGLIAVVATEPLGQWLTGNALPWGRWPWTIHSGVWGMAANLIVCLVVSASSRVDEDTRRRESFHRFLNDSSNGSRLSPNMKAVAWLLALAWTFFAVGPGAVLGNSLFGAPGAGYQAWIFGAPSLWAWQVFWWILGIGLVWFFAAKLELSSETAHERPLSDAREIIEPKGA